MKPEQLHFPGKHPDEVVIFIQRRHWSMLFGKMARWVILMALPIVVVLLLNATSGMFSISEDSVGGILMVLGGSLYLLIVWILLFQDWIDYYLDAIILTNGRIVHIEMRGVFSREVSQLALDRIQDVTIETKGMMSTLFGYGTITIESAGEQVNFIIKNVPEIEKIQSTILMYAKQAPRMGVDRQQPSDPAPSTQQAAPQKPPFIKGKP
ncbi:MAG: PH domain-containing protein [Candidatus Kerfeldbacteria bacterium]